MTEVIAEYQDAVEGPDGSVWAARACARPLEGKWEAWIEFVPLSEGHSPVRTQPETTQVDREDTRRWAEGVSVTYLEGALIRALERPFVVVVETAPPLFDTPAPTIGTAKISAAPPYASLDPYAVFAQGEQRLIDQLAALETQHLHDIVRSHNIEPLETAVFASRDDLIAHILAVVRRHRA
jgi:hypothetical protein